MVIGTLARGGAEHQMVGLAEHLARRGHEIEVVTLHDTGPLQARLEAVGIPALCFGIPTRSWRIRKVHASYDLASTVLLLRAHWRRWRPDVVHAWLPEAQIVALPIARQVGVPVRVMSLRSLRTGARQGALIDRLLSLAGGSATAITANSRAVAADLGWHVGDRTRVVIANGLDIPRRSATPDREPPVGVVVANLISYKGHRDLLAALELITTRPRILLVGDGPERGSLAAEVETRGLQDAVEFRGSVQRPMEVLLEGQFSILPSHTEGLPNAVLEAMSAGLPTIATKVGGVVDLIRDEQTGILVPPHDPKRLAVAIDRLAGDSELRCRLGRNARSDASSYGWEKVCDAYLEVYLKGSSPQESC